MSKTRAEYQKEYRENKKLSNPDYLLLENEKKKLYRHKKREHKIIYKNSLIDLFDNMKTPKGNKYSNITITNYVSKINKILKLLGKTDFNIDYFLDVDKVIGELKKVKYKNLKDYITPIVLLLKANNASTNTISQYHEYMNTEKQKEDEERGNNKLDKDDKDNFLSMPVIKKLINSYDVINGDDINNDKLLYKLIVSFYFENTNNLIPRNDLNILKLISTNKIKNMNDEFNYIVMDKKKPKYIILNNYKTKTTYGSKQKFNISNELSDLLEAYITLNKKENGDYLFTNDKNEPYSKNEFLKLINKSMLAVLKKPISIDLVRSIVITDYYKTPKSINDKKEFHKRLLHSSKVGEEYIIIE